MTCVHRLNWFHFIHFLEESCSVWCTLTATGNIRSLDWNESQHFISEMVFLMKFERHRVFQVNFYFYFFYISIFSFWYFSWLLHHFEKMAVYLKLYMKIKRITHELLEQDFMSIMWKQWLCWSKIILIGLKTFRINGKLIISNFTLIALQCQGFFQINSYFLHKRGLQIVIAENTSLLSE